MFEHHSSRWWLNDTLDEIPLSNRIVGFIYFFFSLFCIVPYSVCLWCIIVDPNLRKKPSYIIVLHIGIADVLQLIFNGLFAGVFTFFGITGGFVTNKIIGGIMNIGWVVYTTLAHVLSFNRFIVLCKPHLKEYCFSKHKTNWMMFWCWIYGFVWFVIYMCPEMSVVFSLVYRNWDYDQRYYPSQILWLIELLQDSFHFFMSIIWYAFCFVAVRKTASQISDQQINENRKERKLLIQAVLICAMIGLTLIGFFAVPVMFNDDPWSTTASNFIWLACCGNNCAIYLKFNKTIRNRVVLRLKFWGRASKSGASVSVAQNGIANRSMAVQVQPTTTQGTTRRILVQHPETPQLQAEPVGGHAAADAQDAMCIRNLGRFQAALIKERRSYVLPIKA